MLLTLQYHEAVQRPACAAFLRGPDPAAWLREIGRWGLAATALRCYLVPESVQSGQLAGLFVVVLDGAALPHDVLEPYGVVADQLFVPVQAVLWPATTPEELRAALLWPRQLLHPSIGLVGFDTSDALDLTTLLTCGPPRPTDWSLSRAGHPPKARLQRVRVLPATAEEVVQSIQQEVGSTPLTELPGRAADTSGTVHQLLDKTRGGMLKTGLWIVRALRAGLGSQVLKLLGITAGLILGLVLLLSLVNNVAHGGTQLIGIIVGIVLFFVLRGLPGSGHTSVSKSGRQPARPAGATSSGVLEQAEKWLGGNLNDLEQKRQNEIERLLRLFGENMEEALKYAIPLGGPYQDRGTAAPSTHLAPRATDFNLGRLGGGGRADVWNIDTYRQELQRSYEAAAQQEAQAGRYQKAAYIQAHLLGNYYAAAKVLEQGGFFREAAALLQDHLKNLPAAAQCLESGGLLLEAAELYVELQQHEKAGDLYQQLEQPELAGRHYERGVEILLGNQDQLAAARILGEKLAAPVRAQQVLLQGWAGTRQPENCLKQYFAVAAATPGADLSAHVREIFQQHTPAERRVTLLEVLAAVNEQHPAPELLTTSCAVAYEVVSAEAGAGNTAPLALLRHFLPNDRLIAADASRYTTSRQRRLSEAVPALPGPEFRLDTAIIWKHVVAHGQQWVAVGLREGRLHLARGNWYGNVEYYSWTTAVEPELNVVLVADERYSTRILLRPSHGVALETKQLPKNRYFTQSLTVECPSWLLPWPTRVALLPEGIIATAQLEDAVTVRLLNYKADGQPGNSAFLSLTDLEPELAGAERPWPCELMADSDSAYHTYWDKWLVTFDEDDVYSIYSLDSAIYQLARSPYALEPYLAVATQTGFSLWRPFELQAPDPEVVTGCYPTIDLRFVGPEHLVVVDEYAAELYYVGADEPQLVHTIETDHLLIAALPTADRKHFALLEATGRISLHSLE
jgi:hypothetical protein